METTTKDELELAQTEMDFDTMVSQAEEALGAKRKGGVKKDRYFEAVGRRKTAISRVRLSTKAKNFTVNGKTLEEYFPVLRLQKEVIKPIEKIKLLDKLGASIKVAGGGPKAQAEASRLGIARALVIFNPVFKKRLSRLGFLTRDSRAVERKKYGLKKARRAPQWVKR